MPAAERSPPHLAGRAGAARLPELRALAEAARERDGARVDPEGWRAARRFHPLVRVPLLRWLHEDGTRRLLQLAHARPGALVLAAGLEARGGAFAEAGYELRQDVRRGRPLDLAIDLAASRMVEAMVALAGEGTCEEASSLSAIEHSLGPGAAEAWLRRARLLVRRAGPRVSPLDLCALPPPALVPEDIPPGAANARWYAAMREVCHAWLGHEVPPDAWSFVSRHAVALAGHATRLAAGAPPTTARAVGAALARKALVRGIATGRWPCRSTGVRRWLEALEREADADARLTPYDGPAPRFRGVTLRPLATVGDLVAEGRRMRNCLGRWHGRLAGQRRWVFAGLVRGAPVAVEVWEIGARYVVPAARGLANRPLTGDQHASVVRWLRALNRHGPPGPAGRTPRDLIGSGLGPARQL